MPRDFGAFLDLLPASVAGVPLRHAMDVRHASFMTPEYLALARRHGVATVFADSDEYPSFADLTGDFVYARLMRTEPDVETGYDANALDRWAERARVWARGGEPDDLPRVEAGFGERRQAARRLHVFHQRSQGARAGGRDGAHRTPGGLTAGARALTRCGCGRTGRWRRRGSRRR